MGVYAEKFLLDLGLQLLSKSQKVKFVTWFAENSELWLKSKHRHNRRVITTDRFLVKYAELILYTNAFVQYKVIGSTVLHVLFIILSL